MIAADLQIDPVELRAKNFMRPSEMPYTVGKTRPDGPPDSEKP
jgi:CO/xanthine dehydrogenase Mo-binding subunit